MLIPLDYIIGGTTHHHQFWNINVVWRGFMAKTFFLLIFIFSLLSCSHTKNIHNDAKELVDNGNEYLNRKEYDQAIDLYNQALKIEPKYTKALFNLAIAYANKNDHDKAIEYYSLIIKNEPNNEDAYFWRGLSYLEIKKKQNCLNDMLKVISLDKGKESQLQHAATTIGLIYNENENYIKAVEYLTLAINRGTKMGHASVYSIDHIYAYRAIANYCIKNYKMAFEDANEALRLNPDNQVAKELFNIAEKDGITLNERGTASISIIVQIGKTINEYVKDYPYLTALSAYLLIDRRSENDGRLFFYYFDENTKKLKGAILRNYSSDKRDWLNNWLTRFISEGHDVEEVYEQNERTFVINPPLADTDEYKVSQFLHIDDEAASLSYIIEYKKR